MSCVEKLSYNAYDESDVVSLSGNDIFKFYFHSADVSCDY